MAILSCVLNDLTVHHYCNWTGRKVNGSLVSLCIATLLTSQLIYIHFYAHICVRMTMTANCWLRIHEYITITYTISFLSYSNCDTMMIFCLRNNRKRNPLHHRCKWDAFSPPAIRPGRNATFSHNSPDKLTVFFFFFCMGITATEQQISRKIVRSAWQKLSRHFPAFQWQIGVISVSHDRQPAATMRSDIQTSNLSLWRF